MPFPIWHHDQVLVQRMQLPVLQQCGPGGQAAVTILQIVTWSIKLHGNMLALPQYMDAHHAGFVAVAIPEELLLVQHQGRAGADQG